MNKIAVVYSTKYGHTKTYADWLKEDLDADIFSIDGFSGSKVAEYELIIFASGVYGDKLPIMDYLKKNLSALPVEKMMIAAVSWYTNDSEEAKQKLISENFPEHLRNTVPFFVLNSGLDKKKVPAVEKAKLLAAQVMIEKKDGRSSDDINALAIIKGYSDQTSKDNLASIKKAVEEFFTPKPATKPAPKSAAAPRPAPTPKPAAPAPKPAPAPAPKPAAPAPKPEAAPKQVTNDENDLSRSVDEAFKNFNMTKPAPAAKEPETNNDAQTNEPVVKVNSKGQVVVSSVLDAINSLNDPNYVPSSASKPAAAPQAPKPADPAPQPGSISMDNTEETVKAVPDQTGSTQESDENAHKNSYMELFASRRKKREEEAAAAAEQGSAPSEPSPVRSAAPDINIDISQAVADAPDLTFTPASEPEEDTQIGDIDFGGYEFIGETKSHTVSKRALNAVQDLAKAKAKAEEEAAKKAAEKTAALAQESDAPVSAPAAPAPVQSSSAAESALEKMRHDMEALAQASESDTEYDETAGYDNNTYAYSGSDEETTVYNDYEESSSGSDTYESSDVIETFDEEEPGDGLDAFAFADTADYYSGNISAQSSASDEDEGSDKAELDLQKLQEQINASIEMNKKNRERMQAKYGKRQKEAVTNPFAVQFEDDYPKGKKNKKKTESAPKRLEDPIDPDIFFSKPGKSKDFDMISDSMPEIKFKNQ